MKRPVSLPVLFAAVVIGSAILLTAYRGNTDWMAMLILLAVLIPSWKKSLQRWLEGKLHDRCDR